VAGDTIYVVSVDGELVAMEKTTGGVFWVKQLKRYQDEKDKKKRISWTGPLLAGGSLVLASSRGQVIMVSPATGEITRTLDIDQPVFVPPVGADGTVYLVTDEARLVALR
jgi:outer membrane protein assembly factor BamB